MNAEVHALAGAYALDALPPQEAAAFAEHLAECDACRQEVAELQVTATQLGLSVHQQPPDALRVRVLAQVHRTRQVPPVTVSMSKARPRRRLVQGLAAAGAAVLVLAGGLVVVRDLLGDDGGGSRQDEIAAVMEAPDAHSATARLRGGGEMTVVSSPRRHQAVVLSQDLPPLAARRVYQLWLVDGQGNARSAQVLIETPGSAGRTHLVQGVRQGDRIAVTREPAGGSEQPTMAPLALIDQV